MADSAASQNALGFLTVVEHEPHGLFGGYLLLNVAGRPLEFHCTAPVKPNRAQQILFGPTLEPYLYGEHIGATLVNKSDVSPLVVLVDHPAALSVRRHIELPTALVCGDGGLPGDRSHGEWIEWTVGENRLAAPKQQAADRETISQRLSALGELFDLSEPFGRIREAIEEAQRATLKAA
jgi:hypothetical protein